MSSHPVTAAAVNSAAAAMSVETGAPVADTTRLIRWWRAEVARRAAEAKERSQHAVDR